MEDWKAAINNFVDARTLVGICLSVLAGIIIHFAYALMKYSHIKNLEKPIEQSRIYLLDQRWWICFIFYFVGLVFTFIALYFVQLSLVASLSCLGIWFAFRYTSWYQAEKVFFKHQLSFTFVVIGTLLFLLFSTKKVSIFISAIY